MLSSPLMLSFSQPDYTVGVGIAICSPNSCCQYPFRVLPARGLANEPKSSTHRRSGIEFRTLTLPRRIYPLFDSPISIGCTRLMSNVRGSDVCSALGKT